MLLPIANHWTTIINLIIQKHFVNSFSTCIIWHKEIEFELQTPPDGSTIQFVNIWSHNLKESFKRDIYNFTEKEQQFKKNNLAYNDWIMKLTVAIEHTNCESFIAFQEDIPVFTKFFRQASIFSLWRSKRSKFLFAYSKDLQRDEEYFNDYLFIDQPNILIIEAATQDSSIFELKTNKFSTSLYAQPEQLYLLNRFDAARGTFEWSENLYPDKIKDLSGREIILGLFNYRPFSVTDFELQPQIKDNAADNPQGRVHVDGTEVRVLITFCEFYNCTVEADTSEKGEWGTTFANTTGTGLLGMMIERHTHMAVGALYSWYIDYINLDLTIFLGRSGITCLVPAPKRLTNWTLPLNPFQFTLWLAVMGCLVLETISLWIAHRMEQTMLGGNQGSNPWISSLQFGYISTLKLFVSQGTDYVVNSTTVRTVLLSCYMIDIIITSIYGGGLAAILTLPSLEEPTDTVYRLYRHGLHWTATSEDWIVTIEDARDDHVISTLLDRYDINTFDSMREKAKTENMAFTVERLMYGHFGNGEFLTPEALDRLMLMHDDIYFSFTVAFVPRLWAFLDKYDNFIYAWHSSGLDKFWEWKVTADYLNLIEQEQVQASMTTNFNTGPEKLDLDNFAGLVVIWLVGMTMSVLAFGFEILYFKYKKDNKA